MGLINKCAGCFFINNVYKIAGQLPTCAYYAYTLNITQRNAKTFVSLSDMQHSAPVSTVTGTTPERLMSHFFVHINQTKILLTAFHSNQTLKVELMVRPLYCNVSLLCLSLLHSRIITQNTSLFGRLSSGLIATCSPNKQRTHFSE